MGEGLSSLVIVTGLSGAGRTTALRAFEDLNFYCVDNLPSVFLEPLVDYYERFGGKRGVAVGVYSTSEREVEGLKSIIEKVSRNRRVYLLFLEAEDSVIIRRYREAKRSHPVSGSGVTRGDIEFERRLFAPLREIAWRVVDTSRMSTHHLRRFIFDQFVPLLNGKFKVSITSFGFKHGIPSYLDILFDVRALPNPYYEDSLRHVDGTYRDVADFVLSSREAKDFVESLWSFLCSYVDFLKGDGRLVINIGVGCTGGVHRSVAVAEWLGMRLAEKGYLVSLFHRELGLSKDLVGSHEEGEGGGQQ